MKLTPSKPADCNDFQMRVSAFSKGPSRGTCACQTPDPCGWDPSTMKPHDCELQASCRDAAIAAASLEQAAE